MKTVAIGPYENRHSFQYFLRPLWPLKFIFSRKYVWPRMLIDFLKYVLLLKDKKQVVTFLFKPGRDLKHNLEKL